MDEKELTLDQEEYLTDPRNRVDLLADKIMNLLDPDDMMLAIMEVLGVEEILPDVGRYYTFIYQPKTLNILYDEYPLVAVTSIHPWGFTGVNYHWGDFRSYTWEEIIGKMHLIYPNEVDVMRSIPYQKIQLNN